GLLLSGCTTTGQNDSTPIANESELNNAPVSIEDPGIDSVPGMSFVRLNIGNDTYLFDDYRISGSVANYSNPTTYRLYLVAAIPDLESFNGSVPSNVYFDISLRVNGSELSSGTYLRDSSDRLFATFIKNGKDFSTYSNLSEFQLTISNWPEVGGKIEGTFSGQFVSGLYSGSEIAPISGSFSIIRPEDGVELPVIAQ
ncbi:MAG: hypothetical protein V1644_02200, partial [Candidatus Micrarchaeota archaeon]